MSTSANDPGTSVSITPFAEVKDPTNSGKFFFENKPEIFSMDRGILETDIVEEGDEVSPEDLENVE